ncbi:MAG: DUF3786 domain-containing protein [Lachnospiraceae bacterium]|nr:DUF3786 domain-containing protein [Lachnospiraceae bacterium]
MSVNYHAFQSRGYLFSNSEAVCEQWRTAFSDYEPSKIARILKLRADEVHLYLSYFEVPYRLCLKNGILKKSPDHGQIWTDELYFNETMSIYHLLYYTRDYPRTANVWVPNTQLDGVVSRNPRVPDPLLSPFAREFTGRTEALDKACRKLNGIRLDKGDVSYEFAAFPQIHLQLVFWDADEDFPAQVQILADKYVTDYVHYETIGCIISDLLELLSSAASSEILE